MTQQALIPDQERSQLKRAFRKDLRAEVNLRLFTQRASPIAVPGRDCKYCAKTQQVLEELVALSPKIHLETVDIYAQPGLARDQGITRVPAIDFGGEGGPRLRFYGIPLGYQMPVIIENIRTISRGISPLSMASRKRLREINQAVHIQVFVTPASAQCPPVARLACALALENQNITTDVVEIEEFPALAQQYGVRSVPMTVINELTQIAGVAGEAEFVEKIIQCGVRRQPDSAPVQP